jgi:hypothetical protein
MESVEIPGDFYIRDKYGYKYLCHKSCITINGLFSNGKFYYLHTNHISNKDIIVLRYKCNTIDEIEEKTYFVNDKFNDLNYGIHDDTRIYLHGLVIQFLKIFNNVNNFIEYLNKNYPESIRNNDIKIALKD